VLYALAGNTVAKCDPITLGSLGSVSLPFADNRAIGVADDGSIFVATWDGVIRRLSSGHGARFADCGRPGDLIGAVRAVRHDDDRLRRI
jgi:hypothetical protein